MSGTVREGTPWWAGYLVWFLVLALMTLFDWMKAPPVDRSGSVMVGWKTGDELPGTPLPIYPPSQRNYKK